MKILERSGVGDAKLLKKLGIHVRGTIFFCFFCSHVMLVPRLSPTFQVLGMLLLFHRLTMSKSFKVSNIKITTPRYPVCYFYRLKLQI